ncbi:Prephenate dehydrogenase [Atractiella rhizophila]|nr:Prephenate dehydrogenase [Atractiella rhizophila]
MGKHGLSVGLIGMGDMGRMYASRLLAADESSIINVCDVPERYESLKKEFENSKLNVLKTGHHVSRSSDFIIYSVPAEHIDKIIAEYGPSTKIGAIVAGQTSTKAPEKAAFDKYLPEDVSIVSIHSLHGPQVPPDGQPLVIIKYRAADEHVKIVEEILAPLKSRYVYLSYEEHDQVTANTQAVTHAAFLSMGTAWNNMNRFPWDTGRYTKGIEIAKINITLRIYSSKWHVYAGLAILNPSAKVQIDCFAHCVSDLFKLMIEEREGDLRKRMYDARDGVFGRPGDESGGKNRSPILLSDEVLNQFSIGEPPNESTPQPPPNSHLALLAMVDCWHTLKINPYHHLAIAATPLFRVWIGVAEYLFRDQDRLNAAIQAALWDKSHRSDDAEFMLAARGWSQCVSYGDFKWYKHRFEETARFFEPRFEEGKKVAAKLLQVIMDQEKERSAAREN